MNDFFFVSFHHNRDMEIYKLMRKDEIFTPARKNKYTQAWDMKMKNRILFKYNGQKTFFCINVD